MCGVGQLLLIEFVRNWKARHNASVGDHLSKTAGSSFVKRDDDWKMRHRSMQPIAQGSPRIPAPPPVPPLSMGMPQSSSSSARMNGPGSIEMQEIKPLGLIAEEKQHQREAKAAKKSVAEAVPAVASTSSSLDDDDVAL